MLGLSDSSFFFPKNRFNPEVNYLTLNYIFKCLNFKSSNIRVFKITNLQILNSNI